MKKVFNITLIALGFVFVFSCLMFFYNLFSMNVFVFSPQSVSMQIVWLDIVQKIFVLLGWFSLVILSCFGMKYIFRIVQKQMQQEHELKLLETKLSQEEKLLTLAKQRKLDELEYKVKEHNELIVDQKLLEKLMEKGLESTIDTLKKDMENLKNEYERLKETYNTFKIEIKQDKSNQINNE